MTTIVLVGTADTKADELAFMRERLLALGAQVLLMDVGVLAAGDVPVAISHDEVAAAAGCTISKRFLAAYRRTTRSGSSSAPTSTASAPAASSASLNPRAMA